MGTGQKVPMPRPSGQPARPVSRWLELSSRKVGLCSQPLPNNLLDVAIIAEDIIIVMFTHFHTLSLGVRKEYSLQLISQENFS